MKKIWILMIAMALPSCKETLSQPPLPMPMSRIVSYVHWQNEGIAGKKIELVQTGETKLTDSTGLAEFSVLAGHYVIRAFEINRGGPSARSIDFSVDTHSGETATVDIIDCLPCLAVE
ncbi:MAG: hypothetical protein HYR76_00570 [Ignavibacteria bacterium]|nr:hypothetical protein [Ignavibacteria bacterium]MBI3765723.1 hypothetical protein [Ignavibacteriales bacterium]